MDSPRSAWIVWLAVAAVLLLVWPGMALFDREQRIAGMPLLYVYVFVAWLLIIGLVRAWMRRAGDGD